MTTDFAPNQPADAAGQQPPARVVTTKTHVACSGGGGALGHPQVWLNLGTDGTVSCPYCSCVFEKADG